MMKHQIYCQSWDMQKAASGCMREQTVAVARCLPIMRSSLCLGEYVYTQAKCMLDRNGMPPRNAERPAPPSCCKPHDITRLEPWGDMWVDAVSD